MDLIDYDNHMVKQQPICEQVKKEQYQNWYLISKVNKSDSLFIILNCIG